MLPVAGTLVPKDGVTDAISYLPVKEGKSGVDGRGSLTAKATTVFAHATHLGGVDLSVPDLSDNSDSLAVTAHLDEQTTLNFKVQGKPQQ